MDTKNLDDLRANPKNPRQINKHDFEALVESIKRFGDLSGVVFNVRTGELVGGHQRKQAFDRIVGAKEMIITERLETPNKVGTVAIGYIVLEGEKFSYREVDWDAEWELSANIAANRIQGQFDLDLLAQINYELSQLENGAELLKLTGQTEDEINKLLGAVGVGDEEDRAGNLSNKFIVPPFSVLDTKQGYWQDRKDAWLGIGIKSEEGRDDALLYGAAGGKTDIVSQKIMKAGGGTSVFDPVLCELTYRWFNVPNGSVLDPFAGGSVRGVIASKLGHKYYGFELRAEQVVANREQAAILCTEPMPIWVEGDSNQTLDKVDGDVDLVFSCPPYADLEVYSKDPNDLSNMPYAKFLEFYRSIITKSCAKLKQDRFAVWVIGEVRAKDGGYYNFVGDTIQAFKDAGLQYYNEMILVNNAGSLPLRAGKTFNSSRKVGKQHQNVLVFYKGNLKAIKANYPELDFSTLADMFTEEKDLQ